MIYCIFNVELETKPNSSKIQNNKHYRKNIRVLATRSHLMLCNFDFSLMNEWI